MHAQMAALVEKQARTASKRKTVGNATTIAHAKRERRTGKDYNVTTTETTGKLLVCRPLLLLHE